MKWMKNNQIARLIRNFVAASLCVSAAASAQEDPQELALHVLETNPEIQARWHEFLASSQDLRQARGSYLPSVDITATGGRVDQDHALEEFDRSQTQFSITQLLFDGFRVRHEVGQAHQFQVIRYYELLDTAEKIVTEALEAYHDQLRYRTLVSLAEANRANHQEVFEQIQSRVDSGVSNSADLSQIRGRLALADSNLMTERSNLHDVTARYLRLAGRTPSPSMTPLMLSSTEIPGSVEDILTEAYTNSPAFHAAITGIDAADEGVQMRRSRYMPTVELRARHTRNDNLNGFDRVGPDNGNENVVELIFNYNLYRGGSDRAATRAAYERANRARALRDKACVDLRQTASIAFNDLATLQSQLLALEIHRDNAAYVVEAYSDQFRIGQRALLDVLDAENESFQAQRAYIHAEYDLIAAQLRMLAAMGGLLETLDITRSSLPSLSDLNADPVEVDPLNACPRY